LGQEKKRRMYAYELLYLALVHALLEFALFGLVESGAIVSWISVSKKR
jgi:hypothetical protein